MWIRVKTVLSNFYHTRIQFALGIFGAVANMLAYIDEQTINTVGRVFGPKYGPIIATTVRVSGALLVAYRASQVRR